MSTSVLRIGVIDPERPGPLDPRQVDVAIAALTGVDDTVGAVLFAHDDKNFCFGGNVAAFAVAEDAGAFLQESASQLHDLVRLIVDCPVPVVTAVRGWATGAGMSLALLGDVIIAGAGARFRPSYAGIGFTPDGGLSWTLPRLVGRIRAAEILLSDRTIQADEALAIGMVTHVVADADVAAAAAAMAARLASGPQAALRGIKTLLATGTGSSLDEHLDRETASIARSAASPDGREGLDAFVAKRAPVFGQETGDRP